MPTIVVYITLHWKSSWEPFLCTSHSNLLFRLQDKLLQLVNKTIIPVVSTVLSKSVISEDHASYLGVYEGAMGYHCIVTPI
ncbi:MAG: hypothetical protein GEU26_12035 [Nitrososphaeraceae archaeon]|nr:hypothetical protein [Nitrososphaeraceae archaeon]